jgi:hypothetical protein
VLVETRDLFFRTRLEELVRRAGCRPTRQGPADLAVVELGTDRALERVGTLAATGIPVIAFGAHIEPRVLRTARDLGATAVPNSQVEQAVRAALAGP